MGLWGVARANTAVSVSLEAFLLLLQAISLRASMQHVMGWHFFVHKCIKIADAAAVAAAKQQPR
jgi:hypothetical protein